MASPANWSSASADSIASDLKMDAGTQNVPKATEFLRDFASFSSDTHYDKCLGAYVAYFNGKLAKYRRWRNLERCALEELSSAWALLDGWLAAVATIVPLNRTRRDDRLTQDRALFHVIEAMKASRLRKGHLVSAEHWETAANVLSVWLGRDKHAASTEAWSKIKCDELSYRARAARLRAFRFLSQHPHQPNDFDEPITFLEMALSFLSEASSQSEIPGVKKALDREIAEVRYWLACCAVRQSLLQRDLPRALTALAEAQEHAVAGRVRFPNYYQYRSADQLKHERLLIRAFEELSSGSLKPAADLLASWLAENVSLEGSNVHAQVKLRHLSIELLIAQAAQRDSLLRDIRNVTSSLPPADRTSRFAVASCEAFVSGVLARQQAIENIQQVFPLDSAPPRKDPTEQNRDDPPPSDEELLSYLPEFLSRWLTEEQESWPGQTVARLSYIFVAYYRTSVAYILRVLARRIAGGAEPMVPWPTRPIQELRLDEIWQIILDLRRMNPGADLWSHDQLLKLSDCLERFRAVTTGGQEAELSELRALVMHLIRSTSKISFPLPVRVTAISPDGQQLDLERFWSRPGRRFVLRSVERKDVIQDRAYFLKAPRRSQTGSQYDERLGDPFNFYSAAGYAEPHQGRFVLAAEGQNDVTAWKRILDDQLPYWNSQIEIVSGEGQTLPVVYRRLSTDMGFTVIAVADEDQETKWSWLASELRDKNVFFMRPDFEGIDPGSLAPFLQDRWRRKVTEQDVLNALYLRAEGGGTVARVMRYLEKKTGAEFFGAADSDARKGEVAQAKAFLATALAEKWAATDAFPQIVRATVDRLRETAFTVES